MANCSKALLLSSKWIFIVVLCSWSCVVIFSIVHFQEGSLSVLWHLLLLGILSKRWRQNKYIQIVLLLIQIGLILHIDGLISYFHITIYNCKLHFQQCPTIGYTQREKKKFNWTSFYIEGYWMQCTHRRCTHGPTAL